MPVRHEVQQIQTKGERLPKGKKVQMDQAKTNTQIFKWDMVQIPHKVWQEGNCDSFQEVKSAHDK